MNSSSFKILTLFCISIALIASILAVFLKDKLSDNVSNSQIESVVADFIKNNPQAIIDSVSEYQLANQKRLDSQAQENLTAKKDLIENSASSPVLGNPKGDVVLVEFFDYSCGYCKKVLPYVLELIKEDTNLKVVFKELPILGNNSVLASKAALAVNKLNPDKYIDFHKSLMKTRVSGKDAILKIASDNGLDAKAISELMDSKEIEKIIDENHELAKSLNIAGTPAFIINGQIYPGAMDYNELKKKVALARKK
jgi:protein-disulfide isomerase